MRALLIDNAKPNHCEFTRLLEDRLNYLCDELVCCQNIEDVLQILNTESPPDFAVLSGSSLNVSEPQKIIYMRKSISTLLRLRNVPILGICFGMQLISLVYGGIVKRFDSIVKCEDTVKVERGSVLLNNEPCNLHVTLSHQDYVEKVPMDFAVYSMRNSTIQMFESLKFLRFGVQFHPERVASNEPICILRNFTKFVHERSSIPVHLKYISDELRVYILFSIGQKKIPQICSEINLDADIIMLLWRNHLNVWNLPARLI